MSRVADRFTDMDTRTKIIPAEVAIAELGVSGAYAAVVSTFDVLTVGLVRRLREIASGQTRIVAIVVDPPEPLLDSRARCELAAGLSLIDTVVAAPRGSAELLGNLQPTAVFHEEAADRERSLELIEHVQQRYRPQ